MKEGRLNGLDLFSGIGGISLALEPWVKTVAYCERDPYAQGVLISRMADGSLDRAPIWDDITTLKGSHLPPIDIIFGGFPCQDISVAGAGAGLAGERSGLFFEIVRLAKEIEPAFLFLENVPAIRTRGLDTVVETLAELGYDSRWTTLSAESVGANHRRNLWFLLAADSNRLNCRYKRKEEVPKDRKVGQRKAKFGDDGSPKSLADADGARLKHDCESDSRSECDAWRNAFAGRSWWHSEPPIRRVDDGVSSRVDRLRCLGNAVVPLQARRAFEELAGLR